MIKISATLNNLKDLGVTVPLNIFVYFTSLVPKNSHIDHNSDRLP